MVTGGAGFIGTNLIAALTADGAEVRVLDDLSAGMPGQVRSLDGVEFVEASIEDMEALRRATQGATEVVHLAARAGVQSSVEDPARDFRVNVLGTFNVLEAARAASVERVVFASSGAVVAAAAPPLHEELPLQPLAPYGASKGYGEIGLTAFSAAYGLQGVALRFSNVYGPFSRHKQSVVSRFIQAGLAGEPLTIHGGGSQTRDFIHVQDAIGAIRAALDQDFSGVLQVGSGRETSIRDLAEAIQATLGRKLLLDDQAAAGAGASRSFATIQRARDVLGWEAKVTLEAGLADTLQWFRSLAE